MSRLPRLAVPFSLSHRLSRQPWLAALLAGVLAVTGLTLLSAPAQAAEPALDGSRYDRAAASCWAIKQLNPSAADGVYWLQTPQLISPMQFYCDQTTDGGGWVLVGRGREGWSFATNGQGSPSVLRTTIDGPGAFAPAALSKQTIDALLGGTRTDLLPDGVRVRRAVNQAGTSWQEMRFDTRENPDWSWAFGGGIPLVSTQVNGVSYALPRDHTRDWRGYGTDNGYLRMMTYGMRTHNWQMGFAYGWTVAGVNNPTSYLWQYSTEGGALPFTQVWLRPKLANLSYPALPMAGAPAQAQRPLMANSTTPVGWGVEGTVTGIKNEFHLEVQALAVRGSTLYVGGEFARVRNASGSTVVSQPYLAAFDTSTGQWLSGFRPQLDGQVWDIQALPSGKLVIAGQFSSVGGAANTRGVASIDPTTGVADPSWKTTVAYDSLSYTKGRALDVQGDWLYIGGTFTQIRGGVGTDSAYASVRHLARVRLSDGRPDTTWAPRFNSDVYELDASGQGDRVYVVGKFTHDSTRPDFIQATGFAAVSTTGAGVLVPGFKPYAITGEPGRNYQQTVVETGDSFWVGGSEHNLQRYHRTTFEQSKGFITRDGGDFQTALVVDGVLYAGAHAQHYVFSGTNYYRGGYPPPDAKGVDPISWLGAWDVATGDYLPEFAIAGLRTRNGNGPWDLTRDGSGCLWFGGDFIRGSGGSWIGGFGKVCPRDSVPPAAPSGLRASRTASGVALTWSASVSTGVTYELLRDGRVIVMPSGTSYTDADAPAGARYWVRAVDSAGNRSATTPAAVA